MRIPSYRNALRVSLYKGIIEEALHQVQPDYQTTRDNLHHRDDILSNRRLVSWSRNVNGNT
jgi:hypothetical protein